MTNTPATVLGDPAAAQVTQQCGCGASYSVAAAVARYVRHCPGCSAAKEQDRMREHDAARAKKLADKWSSVCPVAFRSTVRERLPMPEMLDRVMNWKYGPRGVLLYGATGGGKSRIAWKLAERECLAGRSVAALNAASCVDFAASYEHSAAYSAQWQRGYMRVDLLLLDDVFKGRLSDSFENFLFWLVSGRGEKEKPIVVTMNDTGSSLALRMSQDRSTPMMRRLREDFHHYCFKTKGKHDK